MTKDIKKNFKLETVLKKATSEYSETAPDLGIASNWIEKVNDILLGEKNEYNKRDTEEYKKNTTSKEVENKLTSLIIELDKKKKDHSEFLQEFVRHLRKTKNN